jgi:hypothetical protein
VATPFNDREWLGALVDATLRAHDVDAALAALPAEVRSAGSSRTDLVPAARLLVARSLHALRPDERPVTPAACFREEVRRHVQLLLDLALLRHDPFVRARRRAEIAAFLAAACGEEALALEVTPEEPGGSSDRAVDRALRAAGAALRARFHPPGDGPGALPIHAGAVAVLRRRLARVAIGFHRAGTLDREALARHATYAETESTLLAETLSGLALACAGEDAARPAGTCARLRPRQLARLGLGRAAARRALEAAAAPRPPAALGAAAPEPVRAFLLEQLFLAEIRGAAAGAPPEARAPAAAFADAFARGAGLDPAAVLAARVEAAAQEAGPGWLLALDPGRAGPAVFGADWEKVTDEVVERVSAAVTGNLEALVTEIRETGELGQLLARAASGHALSAEERRKVKAQLLDLAKAVPALAIFAAPGGMLLLPLVAKLLPFSLVPSAWAKPAAARARPRPERVG